VTHTGALLGELDQYGFSRRPFRILMRRIVVSNPKVAGKTIASLNLAEQYQVVLTRCGAATSTRSSTRHRARTRRPHPGAGPRK
jgi:uncharacterized transporter YbjL